MALSAPFTNSMRGHLLFSMYLEDSLPPVTVECAGVIRLYVIFFAFIGMTFKINLLPELQAKSFLLEPQLLSFFFPSGILILS